jgi:hypothetical protein
MALRTFRRTRILFTCVFLTAAVGVPLSAAASGLRLVTTGGAAELELAGGERVAVALPAGGELSTVAAVEAGWVAAGTRRTENGTELVLAAGDGEGFSFLPLPLGRDVRLRQDPVPLVADAELAGLTWLEGEDERSLAVRFARWEREKWGAARTVVAAGPGTQIALSAAALADGSWLLAWSRFDGEDDEVVWSRSRGVEGEAWSAPRRIAADNAVPDITPALLATSGGVLAAWSRYDGEHYRVVTAAFDGRKWSAPRTAGPAGSLYPTWEAAGGAALVLLTRTAVPRGWMAVEVDGSGRALRTAAVAVSGTERPAVEAAGDEATFRWLGSGGEDQVEREQVTVPWARVP